MYVIHNKDNANIKSEFDKVSLDMFLTKYCYEFFKKSEFNSKPNIDILRKKYEKFGLYTGKEKKEILKTALIDKIIEKINENDKKNFFLFLLGFFCFCSLFIFSIVKIKTKIQNKKRNK